MEFIDFSAGNLAQTVSDYPVSISGNKRDKNRLPNTLYLTERVIAVDFKEIQKIVELMNEHGLSQFKLEQDDTKLELKKGSDIDVEAIQRMLASSAPAAPVHHAAPAAAPPAAAAETSSELPAGVKEITSPMVGTFYSSADPEADPFVTIGSKIAADSTVCIVEAMKVMNEIKAEIGGEIIEILVENGTTIQFGDPLYRVKTA